MTCCAIRREVTAVRQSALENTGTAPSGYGPSQLDSAYKLTAAGGSGQTVAVCPLCKIDLVEANSADNADLCQAENEAVALGAKFVSNSWGGDEYSGQATDDSAFNHPRRGHHRLGR